MKVILKKQINTTIFTKHIWLKWINQNYSKLYNVIIQYFQKDYQLKSKDQMIKLMLLEYKNQHLKTIHLKSCTKHILQKQLRWKI